MSIAPTSPQSRYGPESRPGIRAEADGFVVTCVCQWLRWFTDNAAARAGLALHEAKCKGAPTKERPEPKRSRGKSDWTGREGSTWIDKL